MLPAQWIYWVISSLSFKLLFINTPRYFCTVTNAIVLPLRVTGGTRRSHNLLCLIHIHMHNLCLTYLSINVCINYLYDCNNKHYFCYIFILLVIEDISSFFRLKPIWFIAVYLSDKCIENATPWPLYPDWNSGVALEIGIRVLYL